ncbi:MAG TPA: PqqD family protein [Oscillatoriales cyanobacterium M59_W2019_021]|nr:MAG: PqqD family protein [Cyanobacteria bacterium J055]HIK29963.1 PqqD family protein [Oscillatoriales cyanobacterium M4454_W2019_049]HIK51256.1 PqqD family protein [Oscillatoriales cyanobacterium M59_W2019_021]
MISQFSTIVAVREQVSSDLADESVILNLKSGVYYGLNAVGAWIWSQIQQPIAVSSLQEILLDKYDVDPKACEQDLFALLQDLMTAQLIEVENEAAV